ncbi:Alpha/beta hydrolase family-domain-containing protein [Mycena crocata]|nr:Alpha/beta hydrolase family-domain-containing protein [Mycena crocata]
MDAHSKTPHTLPTRTMFPPQKSSHLFDYHTAAHTFRCVGTKWTHGRHSAPGGVKLCLVLLSGVGLTSDVWAPVVERLYGLPRHLENGAFLDSIWALDRPSHGDAGILNETAFSECDKLAPAAEYAATFAAFLASPLLSYEERANLVVVAHSAGVSALIYALPAYKINGLITSLILIEPTIFDDCDMGLFHQWIGRVEKLIGGQKTAWASVSEALSYNRGWRAFHPEVRTIIANTFFRQKRGSAEVINKTSPVHETAAFKEVALSVDMARRLDSVVPFIPTHLIYGSRRDYWPKVLDEAFFRYIHKHKNILASITPIAGQGHFAPQEAPDEVAASLHRVLAATPCHASPVMAKL